VLATIARSVLVGLTLGAALAYAAEPGPGHDAGRVLIQPDRTIGRYVPPPPDAAISPPAPLAAPTAAGGSHSNLFVSDRPKRS
jgi:hypothetical protein